jgi:hypothetical protein
MAASAFTGIPAQIAYYGTGYTPNNTVFVGAYGRFASTGGVGWLASINVGSDGNGIVGVGLFDICGNAGLVTVWGYDYATNTWSNGVNVTPFCEPIE